MWAIRRASVHLKSVVLTSGTSIVRSVKPEIASSCLENCNAVIIESKGKVLDALMCSRRFCSTSVPPIPYSKAHTFCSRAGDEMEDESIFNSELIPNEGFADDEPHDSEILDLGPDVGKGNFRKMKIRAPSSMTKAILADTRLPVSKILEKWVKAGNKVTLAEISVNILYFRKHRMFSQALQLSEWLGSSKIVELTASNYASLVDLIAKVRGIVEAEKYIHQQIPESLRTEVVYRTLLANCVVVIDVKKSEELFDKMKDLFPISCFSCDQMLLLYKRTNRKKISDILSFMKKGKIKRSTFTYQTLIDAKWQSGHISGMERLLEEMKSDGLEPTMHILASIAKNYVNGGLKAKAEAVLKDMEKGDSSENRWVCQLILPIYASLERGDEVDRIWKKCERNPTFAECVAGIQAFGRLNRIEEAEAAFDKLLRIVKRPSSRHYAFMLSMYADKRMLDKGKDLVTRMNETGVTATPPAMHALAKLYARCGEVEKAEAVLQKAVGNRRGMELLSSFLSVLDAYAEKGDIRNAEKIFQRMKRAGLPASARSYRSLLYAYVNAKDPAYGFRERMRSDNVAPDRKLDALLARVGKFKKPAEEEEEEEEEELLP